MFQPRAPIAPDLEAQRLAWANEDVARSEQAYREMYPDPPPRRSQPGPDDFCRACRGRGEAVDDTDCYSINGKTDCATCGGTGWS